MNRELRPSASSARRFLAAFFSLLLLGLAAILTLNLTADPFRVFGATRRAGFNDRVPNTTGYDRMARPYEILRVHPRTVLMGSSTAHEGFIGLEDWDVGFAKPVYNYALLGSNVHEVRLSLAHAVRENPVETVIVVADFYGYNIHYADNERFNAARLTAASGHHWPGFSLEDLGALTLGIDAFKMSLATLRDSRLAVGPPAGADEYRERALHLHFRRTEISYPSKWFPPPRKLYEFADHTGDRLADYDEILRLCLEKNLRLIVVFPPIHARMQEAMASTGAWPQYEAFKRAVVDRTQARVGRTNVAGQTPALELWDFSLYNARTRETIPPDDGPPMTWWYDGVHFTPDFGRALLDEIQGRSAQNQPAFGVRLAPGHVDLGAHLAAIRADLLAFRVAQPEVVADVREGLGIKAPPPFAP